LSGPTTQLTRNFGLVGGTLGAKKAAPTSGMDPRTAASAAAASLPRQGRPGVNQLAGYRRPRGSPSPLLGRGIGTRIVPWARPVDAGMQRRFQPSALSRMHTQAYAMGPPGLGRHYGSTPYLRWVQPGVVVRHHQFDVSGEEPGVASTDADQGGRLLNELASEYVARRRDQYEVQGWQAFKAGEYQRAFDRFALADAVSQGDPRRESGRHMESQARARVKVGMVQAAIAAEQYAQAATALMRLLEWYGKSNDASFMVAARNLRSRYGDGAVATVNDGEGDSRPLHLTGLLPADHPFDEHLSRLQQVAGQHADSFDLQALYAFILWGDTREREGSDPKRLAMLKAEAIQDDPLASPPWKSLYEAMDKALDEPVPASSAATQPASEVVSAALPWEVPAE
jgi:hypothetical protein